ncbi:glycosyltransferase family 9 protein [Endomicrobium proavitum]|uniref:Putative lipopolysaccharide heptosyltransferase II n=1 Tax=Endomicrobium proavitum TaxID=1408281 RepID=A0A0G3WHV4_9BACT|nr:glycosyltransferase family 9 protein [Endomicrobium proavitum]AKL97923.1 putative lipopolysaccharide heptosyltransferase II [Endomicrobium proavitum]
MKNKIISGVVFLVVWLFDKTVRKKFINGRPYASEPSLYPFWHGTSLQMVMNNQKSGIVIMTSLSKDGDLISSLVKSFGFDTVRGSSSRGAEKALKEMVRLALEGKKLAYAADGPRGPYHKLKSGIIYTAQKSGLPIYPVATCPKRKITLRSWDRTEIPIPFTKVIQIYSAPIYVKPEDDIEQKRVEVENELNKIFEFVSSAYWQKDISRYLSLNPSAKILIVQPSRIGDIIFALPTLAAIKRKYPHAKISWIVDERCYEILEGNPLLDKIFIWDRTKRSLGYYKKLRKSLRNERFDLSIDLHGLAKSAMLVKLAGAKFKIASSSTNGMREFSRFFSKEIKNTNAQAHCIDRHLETAKYLQCDGKIEYPIYIPEHAYESVKVKLENKGVDIKNIIAMHAGGGWTSRRWAAVKFGQLAEKLNKEFGADIILIGGKEGGLSEKGLSEDILSSSKVKITDMTGEFTLKELCAFFKLCKVFVGNEAGPMHIATALNIPSVAILGPTNAKRTGPYAGGNTQIIQHKFSCQPCRNRSCKNPVCMHDIGVEEVFEAVKNTYGRLEV